MEYSRYELEVVKVVMREMFVMKFYLFEIKLRLILYL